MKKLQIFLFSVLVSTTAFGQNGTTLSLELGPNLASMRGNSIVEKYNNQRVGFYLGLGLQHEIVKNLSIKSGIAFERKGTAYKSILTDNSGSKIGELKYHSNFDYITVPIMLRWSFGKKTQLFINAGSYFGF